MCNYFTQSDNTIFSRPPSVQMRLNIWNIDLRHRVIHTWWKWRKALNLDPSVPKVLRCFWWSSMNTDGVYPTKHWLTIWATFEGDENVIWINCECWKGHIHVFNLLVEEAARCNRCASHPFFTFLFTPLFREHPCTTIRFFAVQIPSYKIEHVAFDWLELGVRVGAS